MATGPSTITNLPAAATITGAEIIPMDQGGNGLSVQSSLLGLITGTAATTALTGAEIFQTDQGGTLKKVTLDQLITQQAASTTIAGTELVIVDQGGTTKKTTVAQLITQLSASSAIAGTELVETVAGTTPQKTTVAQLVTQATAAGNPASADLFPATQSGAWRSYTLSQIAAFSNYYTGGGTANAQTVTMSPVPTAYYAGMVIAYLPTAANTGAATINANSLGAKNIFAYGAALIGGELQTNVPAVLVYDGTQFQFINPNDATGSFTVTLTGMSSATTGTLNWRIAHGKSVILTALADINNTSNATTLTLTGIPAAIQPTTTKYISFFNTRDSSSQVAGMLQITGASSTWTVGKGLTATSAFPGAYTASGNKGIGAGVYTYTLD